MVSDIHFPSIVKPTAGSCVVCGQLWPCLDAEITRPKVERNLAARPAKQETELTTEIIGSYPAGEHEGCGSQDVDRTHLRTTLTGVVRARFDLMGSVAGWMRAAANQLDGGCS